MLRNVAGEQRFTCQVSRWDGKRPWHARASSSRDGSAISTFRGRSARVTVLYTPDLCALALVVVFDSESGCIASFCRMSLTSHRLECTINTSTCYFLHRHLSRCLRLFGPRFSALKGPGARRRERPFVNNVSASNTLTCVIDALNTDKCHDDLLNPKNMSSTKGKKYTH